MRMPQVPKKFVRAREALRNPSLGLYIHDATPYSRELAQTAYGYMARWGYQWDEEAERWTKEAHQHAASDGADAEGA